MELTKKNSDDEKTLKLLKNKISDDIILLRTKRGKNRDAIFNKTATTINEFLVLNSDGVKEFKRKDILDLIPTTKKLSFSTRKDYTKTIIEKMVFLGLIVEEEKQKISFMCRRYILKSNDYGSYKIMMAKNGFKDVNFYKYYQDNNGIPRKKKVGTSKLNGFPVDKNGDSVEDWDLSVLKQTKQREKQGVYSYGNKSICWEQRPYTAHCLMLLDDDSDE